MQPSCVSRSRASTSACSRRSTLCFSVADEEQQEQRLRAKTAVMHLALQQSWPGADVIADAVRAHVVYGIVTDFVDWTFLRYDTSASTTAAHEVALRCERGGVPTKPSLFLLPLL